MDRIDARTRLEALAAFAPELRDPRASAGQWATPTGSGTSDDPLTMPAFQSSELIDRFVEMAYRVDWVTDFDWTKWSASPEGNSLLQDPSLLSGATADQIGKVMTTIVRADRFSEGELAARFRSGHLLALAERAEALLRE